jgi:hypothetical protein
LSFPGSPDARPALSGLLLFLGYWLQKVEIAGQLAAKRAPLNKLLGGNHSVPQKC